jgi:hypothetical protein
LSNNKDLDEELVNDEQNKKERRIIRSVMMDINKECFVKNVIMKAI